MSDEDAFHDGVPINSKLIALVAVVAVAEE